MKNVHTLCGCAASALGALMMLFGYRLFITSFLLLGGIAWMVYGVLYALAAGGSRPAKFGVKLCNLCLALAFISFVAIQSVILSDNNTDSRYDERYVIALGAGLHGEVPSLAMQSRIDALVEYMQKNPYATAVLCGGMGRDESITEAEAFRRALQRAGIGAERMLLDTESRNTAENLENAAKLINQPGTRVAVLTNDFHLWRGKLMARRAGLLPTGVCAKTPRLDLALQYYLREYFSVIKALVFR